RSLIEDLAAEWQEGGREALRVLRVEKPDRFVHAALSILPKGVLFSIQQTPSRLQTTLEALGPEDAAQIARNTSATNAPRSPGNKTGSSRSARLMPEILRSRSELAGFHDAHNLAFRQRALEDAQLSASFRANPFALGSRPRIFAGRVQSAQATGCGLVA